MEEVKDKKKKNEVDIKKLESVSGGDISNVKREDPKPIDPKTAEDV